MKRGRWSAERWARFKAKKAAKARQQPINGVIDLVDDSGSETDRMQQALHIIQTLSDPGRAYVMARLEQENL